jgi:type VI secretion system protein
LIFCSRFMPAVRRPAARWSAAVLAVALLASCATKNTPSLKFETVSLTAIEAANDNSPVAVDLLLVRDQALIDKLLALTSDQWFQQKAQFEADYPKDLSVYGWEIVPGQTLEDKIPATPPAWAGIVFTSYHTAGAHRLRVFPAEKGPSVALRLEAIDAVVQ